MLLAPANSSQWKIIPALMLALIFVAIVSYPVRAQPTEADIKKVQAGAIEKLGMTVLGDGFNSRTGLQKNRTCIVSSSPPKFRPFVAGLQGPVFSFEYFSSFSAFAERTGFSTSVRARAGMAKVAASMAFSDDTKQENSSEIFVATTRVPIGELVYQAPVFNPEVLRGPGGYFWLNNHRLTNEDGVVTKAFEELKPNDRRKLIVTECGDQFVSMVRVEIELMIVAFSEASNFDSARKIAAAFNGQYASAKAEVDFQREVREKIKQGKIKVELWAGSGVEFKLPKISLDGPITESKWDALFAAVIDFRNEMVQTPWASLSEPAKPQPFRLVPCPPSRTASVELQNLSAPPEGCSFQAWPGFDFGIEWRNYEMLPRLIAASRELAGFVKAAEDYEDWLTEDFLKSRTDNVERLLDELRKQVRDCEDGCEIQNALIDAWSDRITSEVRVWKAKLGAKQPLDVLTNANKPIGQIAKGEALVIFLGGSVDYLDVKGMRIADFSEPGEQLKRDDRPYVVFTFKGNGRSQDHLYSGAPMCLLNNSDWKIQGYFTLSEKKGAREDGGCGGGPPDTHCATGDNKPSDAFLFIRRRVPSEEQRACEPMFD